MSNTQTIQYKSILLTLRKDHNIYEVYHKDNYLGYFHYTKLQEANIGIASTGFYNGYNYDYRLRELKII